MDRKSLEKEGREVLGVPLPTPGRPSKERKAQKDRIFEETKEESKKSKVGGGKAEKEDKGRLAVEAKAKATAEAAEKKREKDRFAAEEKERKRLEKVERERLAADDKAKAVAEAAEKKRLEKEEKGRFAAEEKEHLRIEKVEKKRIAAEEKQAAEAERLTDTAKQRHIPGMKYRQGLDKTLKRAPHNECESQSEWWLDPKAAYPPASCKGFTDKTLTMLPSLVVHAEGGQSVIRWGHPSNDYTMKEWEEMVADWQERFPNIKDKDKGTRHETRSKSEDPDTMKTTAPDTIRACWALLPSCRPSKYSGAVANLLEHFKVDMWGNVVCLPKKLPEGRASDASITSFDVDHLFPYSRGGRSVRSNFAACQSFANRHIKVDNLIQCLDPVAMNCGLMYPQLLAMCDAVLEEVHDKRNTTQNRCDAILYWLTSAQENGDKFNQNFQKEVNRTLDGRTLIQFFESHFSHDKEGAQGKTKTVGVARALMRTVLGSGSDRGVGGGEELLVQGAVAGGEGKKNKKKMLLRTDKCSIA